MRVAIITAGLVASLAAATTLFAAPFTAGAQPGADKNAPDRGKIAADIRGDLANVVDQLNRQDPGKATRQRQQRILDNIDKLLRGDDDPPPPPQGKSPPESSSPPPSRPANQDPSPSPRQPMENAQTSTPRPAPIPAVPARATQPARSETPNNAPRTLEELRKTSEDLGFWGERALRQRPEMDAYLRDRFHPRYAELLREYYRSLAESSRKGD